MTEKRDMKWALEYMQDLAASAYHKYGDENAKLAANMLRNGGPVVDITKTCHEFKCETCGRFPVSAFQYLESMNCSQCGADKIKNVKTKKHWTEREKIQIVTEKSEPTSREIK